ncbi:hypothetical protein F5X68DRAFT_232121 [Plectosphaerella plurivora]|uniref:Uncharacterized protein n=1 Tax=Plectosphaerella plurivora TaxID=936078 RepID=A0A9P8VC12_9PEZI|nr:hypothetical protein F5X68DRAFT_232121 [Plectosphaerella plurivora]
MAADETGPRPTPKRKRGDNSLNITPLYTTAQFSFRLPDPKSDEDGSASPRTRVVQTFKGLHLDEQPASSSGGGVAAGQQALSAPQRSLGKAPAIGGHSSTSGSDQDDDAADEGLTMRKRQKVPDVEMRDAGIVVQPLSDPSIPKLALDADDPATIPSNAQPQPQPEPEAIPLKVSFSSATQAESTELQRSYPSINRLQDSTSRNSRKRAGTPPLAKGRIHTNQDDSDDDVAEIVEPIRASLTWHENEITVYDPDDSDDDGTGVNGIGFKPTPALARIRTQKRRQQLLEYKKREDREARARRNQRRRGSTAEASVSAAAKKAMAERRVHFTETGAPAAITTN